MFIFVLFIVVCSIHSCLACSFVAFILSGDASVLFDVFGVQLVVLIVFCRV